MIGVDDTATLLILVASCYSCFLLLFSDCSGSQPTATNRPTLHEISDARSLESRLLQECQDEACGKQCKNWEN